MLQRRLGHCPSKSRTNWRRSLGSRCRRPSGPPPCTSEFADRPVARRGIRGHGRLQRRGSALAPSTLAGPGDSGIEPTDACSWARHFRSAPRASRLDGGSGAGYRDAARSSHESGLPVDEVDALLTGGAAQCRRRRDHPGAGAPPTRRRRSPLRRRMRSSSATSSASSCAGFDEGVSPNRERRGGVMVGGCRVEPC